MKDFEIIKDLVGEQVTETDLKWVDCYVRPQMGIFIPTAGTFGYAARPQHTHPSYMIVIYFEQTQNRPFHYTAAISAPNVPHNDETGVHYYCLLIEKPYFEQRYFLYADTMPCFCAHPFLLCSDVLKALNTFAFEYSKSMPHADVTLDAQAEIITHWIIRSLLGETLDMRAVSSDYSVARAQHYMEQHYMEPITISKLAALGYVSASAFQHKFKQATGVTPIAYLIAIRLVHAKTLLQRKQIPVTEIAMRCGFSSSSHFSTCFQQNFGISPTAYRDKYTD